jgi:ABC-type multidrug transport system fused ATPase/permease subunit
MSEQNSGDDRQALKIAIASLVILALLGVALMLFLPLLASFVDQHFSAGMGLKDAAVVAFFTTVVTLVIFAVAAGDGLLGELQFMLSGFFGFFLVLWLLIAWIF